MEVTRLNSGSTNSMHGCQHEIESIKSQRGAWNAAQYGTVLQNPLQLTTLRIIHASAAQKW